MNLEDLANLSDDEILAMATAPQDAVTQTPEEVEAARVAAETAHPTAEELAEQQRLADEQAAAQQQGQNQEAQLTTEELAAKAEADANKSPEELEAERLAAEEEQPDYKTLYEGLIKPLKANGKEIPLQSHDELIQLAQMGANYTRKMQQLAPHRKALLMLEQNELLDPTKLGFLIDLQRKDPQAIQKLLKESGVNPLDIDVEAEPTYQGGNHQVSDAQVNFQSALEDAQSTEVGQAVLQSIHSTWDQASKEVLFKQPDILATMTAQHEEGFYTRIVGEMDRRRMLGRIPAGQTWLESYKEVGEQMAQAGHFNDLVAPAQEQRQTPQPAAPVATRVAAAKPPVAAAAKAAAAAPSRVTTKPAQNLRNPLEMDDEEFMKQFANRL